MTIIAEIQIPEISDILIPDKPIPPQEHSFDIIEIRVPCEVYMQRPSHAGASLRSNLAADITRLFLRNLGTLHRSSRDERDFQIRVPCEVYLHAAAEPRRRVFAPLQPRCGHHEAVSKEPRHSASLITRREGLSGNLLTDLKVNGSSFDIIEIRVPCEVYMQRPSHAGASLRSNLAADITRLCPLATSSASNFRT
ncbi:Uncharacterized protein OBRU01_00894 [Operophtera brumata]|uniref:Uncharacterized protein n=1 Tax=Operophtera brumata TaxID=104452 RepID=A0A0L7LUS2_OPEBR|nr:Uncharacterized protein OBRU01_00894 [Operophtera brumata]